MAAMRPSIMSDGATRSAAGFGVQHAHPREHVARLVVEHLALRADQAVVPQARVGVQRNIRDHAGLGQCSLDRTERFRKHRLDALTASRASGVFFAGSIAGKIANARTPSSMARWQFLDRQVDGKSASPGHGANRNGDVRAADDKLRKDKAVRCQAGLPHQAADGVGAAKSPRASKRAREGAGLVHDHASPSAETRPCVFS